MEAGREIICLLEGSGLVEIDGHGDGDACYDLTEFHAGGGEGTSTDIH